MCQYFIHFAYLRRNAKFELRAQNKKSRYIVLVGTCKFIVLLSEGRKHVRKQGIRCIGFNFSTFT